MDNLQTPYFTAAGTLMAEEEGLDRGKDWTNTERHPRDPNCTIEHGGKNGVAFFSKIQHNMDDWLTYAKIRRDQYNSASSREKTKLMGLEKYGLPHVLVDDFTLRGINVSDAISNADHYEIDKIMLEEYPALLWIPASAMRTRQMVQSVI